MRHYQQPLPGVLPEEVGQYHNDKFENDYVQLEVEIQSSKGVGMVGPWFIKEEGYKNEYCKVTSKGDREQYT